MVLYKVTVKTGDKSGAGTDANVWIILHGKGNQTESFDLDNCFRNDFERGNTDIFSVESEIDIPEVKRVEIWRDDFGLFANWNLDWISVTNVKSGITSTFPSMQWIEKEKHYFLNQCDTCLPQNDPFKIERMQELDEIRKQYELEVKIPGIQAQVKNIPDGERFPFGYMFNIQWKTKQFREIARKALMANGLTWKNLDDVRSVYTKEFGTPKGAAYVNNDASFGRQRLASMNPTILTLCTGIPAKFAVTEEMLKPLLEGKTIKEAIESKRMFIIDLAIMEGIPAKRPDLVVPCPMALFYFNNAQQLMPVAIQLYQTPAEDNPVFLPTDPEYTWMTAKLWYNLADATYHQALTHLNFTHLMMEGICVSAKRQLSASHPIYRLLSPHFLYLLAIDHFGLGILINPGGYFDKLSSGGVAAGFALMRKSLPTWRLDVEGTLPEQLKSRGVYDFNVLNGAYHFRDDALLLYDAIEGYVHKYVSHYYEEDGAMCADFELQNWGEEIVKSRESEGVGILGVPNNGKFETVDQLVVTLTAIIYTCSVGHASANFPQYDEYGAPLNYPFSLTGLPPKDKKSQNADTILKSIVNRQELYELMTIINILSEKATQSLGDFEDQFITDPPAVKILEEFRKDLQKIGKIIDERNSKRKYPYEYLHPKFIPNAISI